MPDSRETRSMRPPPQSTAVLRTGGNGDGARMLRPRGPGSCATEQSARPPQQDRHCQRINEECAEFGQQVFETAIGDAKQQRGDKWPANAAEPADGDDDQ